MFQNKKIKQLQSQVEELEKLCSTLEIKIKNLDLSYHECNLRLISLDKSKQPTDKVKFTIQERLDAVESNVKGRGRPKKKYDEGKKAIFISIPMPIFKILQSKYNLPDKANNRMVFSAHLVRNGLLVMNTIKTNIVNKESKVLKKGAIWIEYEFYHKLYELSKISKFSICECVRMMMYTYKDEELPNDFIQAVKKVGIRNLKTI